MKRSRLALVLSLALLLSFVSQGVMAQKVKLVQVIPALSFAPTYVAMDKGFFKEEGVQVSFQRVRGGAAGKAAISGGSAEFCACSGNDLVDMARKGIAALGVNGIATGMTMNIYVNNAFLARAKARGITPASSLRDRIRALKNAKLGVTSLGGAPDLYSRWLIGTVGLDHKKDINNIAIGTPPALRAAALKGSIDGFMLSPPLAQQMEFDKQGTILIYATEVPEFKAFVHEVLITQKELIRKNRGLVEKVVRSFARSNNFIQDETAEASKFLQKRFARMNPEIITKSVEIMKGNFGRDGRMNEAMWKNTLKVNLDWREPGHGFDTKEGPWWTNEYIKGVR